MGALVVTCAWHVFSISIKFLERVVRGVYLKITDLVWATKLQAYYGLVVHRLTLAY